MFTAPTTLNAHIAKIATRKALQAAVVANLAAQLKLRAAIR